MRATTYAACYLAALAISAGACVSVVSAASGAARALSYRACVTEAALANLSPAHCATRADSPITTATGY